MKRIINWLCGVEACEAREKELEALKLIELQSWACNRPSTTKKSYKPGYVPTAYTKTYR